MSGGGETQGRARDLNFLAGRDYPQGVVWGKYTLTALPADAIGRRASISRREGQSAFLPPRVAATTPATSPDIPAASNPNTQSARGTSGLSFTQLQLSPQPPEQ